MVVLFVIFMVGSGSGDELAGAFIAIMMILFVGGILWLLTSGNHRAHTPGDRPTRPGFKPGDGDSFEVHIAHLLRDLGYAVHRTPKGADFGVDLIATRNGRKVVVQAKNYEAKVGKAAVDQVFSGMAFYQAQEAWVVGRSGYTAATHKLAQRTGVKLHDVQELEAQADHAWAARHTPSPPPQTHHQPPPSSSWRNHATNPTPTPTPPSYDGTPPWQNAKSTQPQEPAPPPRPQTPPPPPQTPPPLADRDLDTKYQCWQCEKWSPRLETTHGLATCPGCGARTLIA